MEKQHSLKVTDNPGVYIPPPLFYAVMFFITLFFQKIAPLPIRFFSTSFAFLVGMLLILAGIGILLPALLRFLKTKNTLITIKPANSLQTSGIYSFTRNPMYLGLLTLYAGIAFLKGNLWTLLFIPLVIFTITYFVILKEEKYLSRAFGEDYVVYRKKVKRWI